MGAVKWSIALLVVLGLWQGIWAEQGELKVGQVAPDFVLPTFDDSKNVRFQDVYKSKPLTILIIWDSHCPDCLRAVAKSAAFLPRADSLGVGMLSVNGDDRYMFGVRTFIKGAKLPAPVLWDERGLVARTYGAAMHSFNLFLVDGQGIIRYVHYDRPPEVLKLLDSEVKRALRPKGEEQGLGEKPPE